MTIRDWERYGLARPGGKRFPRPDDLAFLLIPAGVQGPGFLMLPNFRAIMKYNPAEAYALAIGHLADRLRGGGEFAQDWPRYERVLSRDERLELQQLLARRGYDVGEPDGHLGARTRAAIREFSGQDRAGSRRLCLGGRPRPAARPLRLRASPRHLRVDIFCALLTHAGRRRRSGGWA